MSHTQEETRQAGMEYSEPVLAPTTNESFSLAPIPDGRVDGDARIVNYVQFYFYDRGGFDKWLVCSPQVNRESRVFASICEVDAGGRPFLGAASVQIHNIIPQDDHIVIVRGHIGWESDIRVRVSILAV
ncbi:hypothetical protein [Spirillospora sp. CA-128828]|uniref:hypothetical protein n=1 Tax=Spirillospora sp. CA-128828 TaxID=3240033 RepID=UPI003D8C634C